MEQDYRGMEEARQVRHNAGSFSQCARATHVLNEAHIYFMYELSPHTVYEVHT